MHENENDFRYIMEDNIIFPNPPVNKIHLLVILFFPVIGIHGDANSRGAGGPAEKDLGRHRLRIGSRRSKTNISPIFIEDEGFP